MRFVVLVRLCSPLRMWVRIQYCSKYLNDNIKNFLGLEWTGELDIITCKILLRQLFGDYVCVRVCVRGRGRKNSITFRMKGF